MKTITPDEFKNLPVVDGIRQCPGHTDYSAISRFGKGCRFGEGCSFGKWCRFSKACSFGKGCSFGEECSFGERCSFGEGCRFGEGCSFGKECSFGEECHFGEWCSFGKACIARSPHWAFVYPPPFETSGPIRPPETCRRYWCQRLGVLSLTGCYDEIAAAIVPTLPTLLKRTDWTDCERRIIESWLPQSAANSETKP